LKDLPFNAEGLKGLTFNIQPFNVQRLSLESFTIQHSTFVVFYAPAPEGQERDFCLQWNLE